jgi:histidine decarboxylase
MRPKHTSTDADTRRELEALALRLNRALPVTIGFPSALDFDYTPLSRFFARHVLNNVGDPTVDGTWVHHTKAMEREVLATVADLLRAPRTDRWGYVTSGATEGNLCALYVARRAFADAVVYHSDAAHYSVPKAVDLLAMSSEVVRTDARGEVDYADLRAKVSAHRDRPAVMVANIGTTMTEAVDDVRRIRAVLDDLEVKRQFIHADAALAGLPLALLGPFVDRPGFDFADGADSMIISGHKFIGSPVPCGVVVIRSHHNLTGRGLIPYIGTTDTTIAGSRSGHAPLLLWYALRHYGIEGLRQRAERCRRMAEYTQARLTEFGWEAYRHPYAFTVVMRTPPPAVLARWVLPSNGDWSHIVCVPGVSTRQIDAFLGDLRLAVGGEAVRGRSRWQRAFSRQSRGLAGVAGRAEDRPHGDAAPARPSSRPVQLRDVHGVAS